MRWRQGVAPVLCADGVEADLPADWPARQTIRFGSASLMADASPTVAALLAQLNALSPISSQTRLAVPTLVIAPTEAEVHKLLADPAKAFAGIADKPARAQRTRQLRDLVKALQRLHPGWPKGFYGAQRGDWCCFGAASPSIDEVLDAALRDINAAHPGSRERELLQQAELVRKPCRLDEYIDAQDGSGDVIAATCEAGALVIVDELALLHPGLREAARTLLAAERCAVATVSACDPAHSPTPALLGELSFLRVGAVVERFQQRHDLQCELALNSATRLQRWLRGAVPRLVCDLAGLAARPGLVNRVDDLLAEAP
jgi:hypothetical protein